MSPANVSQKPAVTNVKLDVANNKKRFEDVFPSVVEELLDSLRKESMPEEAVEWYRRVRRLYTQRRSSWMFEAYDLSRYLSRTSSTTFKAVSSGSCL